MNHRLTINLSFFIAWIHILGSTYISPVQASRHPSFHSKRNNHNIYHQHHRYRHSNSAACAFAFELPSSINLPTILAPVSSATVAYFGLITYFDRPQGKLYSDKLRIAPSQIPNAGLGLYATETLPERTKLGTYPGVVRPLNQNIKKLMNHPECEAYIWRFTDSLKVIDPTDSKGQIQNVCQGGSQDTPLSLFFMENVVKWSVPTILTRINEPPPGFGGCNVRAVEDLESREVLFELTREVYEGEELFMDYGLTYDRSSYTNS